jgi:GAF domain-containing protein
VRSVDAVPLRLRDRTVGALNLFRDSKGGSTVQDLAAIQALADVASISLLQARNVRDAEDTADHLQIALDSRVAIEQAKGIVSARLSVELEDAFELLRQYSRHHNIKLTRVCLLVVEGELAPTDLT